MKFTRTKVTGLGGEPEVWFVLEGTKSEEDGFSIVAGTSGVRLQGRSPILQCTDDLDSFAQIVSRGWAEHGKLKPRLLASRSGH